MDTNKMRADFEESMKTMTFSVDLSRGNHGCYVSLRTHELYCSWVASWQASRSAVVVALPETRWGDAYGAGWNDMHSKAVIAIEAQGLKVAP